MVESTSIQRDLKRLEKWADVNIYQGEVQCSAPAGTSTQYRLGSSLTKEVFMNTKLNMSPQGVLVAKKASSLLGCTRKVLPTGRGRFFVSTQNW